MKKLNFILLLLVLSISSKSQLLAPSSSSIACNLLKSSAIFTVSNGMPPYIFSVQTPSCASDFSLSASTSTCKIMFSCPGNYTITASDANSVAIGNATHTVSQNTNWKISIGMGIPADTVCAGYCYVLFVNEFYKEDLSYNMSNYMWSNGETTKAITPCFSVATTHSVTALATFTLIENTAITRTCTLSADRTFYVEPCEVGIPEISSGFFNLSVFPNPVSGSFQITSNSSFTHFDASIRDCLGKLIYDLGKIEQNKEVDIRSLSKGIYFLTLSTQGFQKTFKILKE